jgi:quinol monooxygenase YgiN
MVTLGVHHRVRDFATWKQVFDDHEDVRRGHGEIEHRIYQLIDDPNRVVVHNDFPSEEAALAFRGDPSLPEAMERGGVEGEPGIGLVERAEQKRYAEGSVAVTLVVHHRVHDYDVWKPVFDEHEDVRRGHGELEHRIYRTVGDGNSIVVHNDFPSEEAARAFAADPSLPEAMERGGVDGTAGTVFITCTERKVYAASALAR